MIDVVEVTAIAVVVETSSDDELVRDGEAEIVDRQVELVCVRLVGHRGDAQVPEAHGLEHIDEVLVGASRIDDVLDDNNTLAVKVVVEPDEILDIIRGFGSAIGGEFHARYLALDVQSLEQVNGEHDGPVEGNQEYSVVIFVVLVDLIGHPLHSRVDFGFRDEFHESLVQNID